MFYEARVHVLCVSKPNMTMKYYSHGEQQWLHDLQIYEGPLVSDVHIITCGEAISDERCRSTSRFPSSPSSPPSSPAILPPFHLLWP